MSLRALWAAVGAALTAMAGFSVAETAYEAVPEFIQAHGCQLYRAVTQGEGQQLPLYELRLPGRERTVSLCFPACCGAEFTALIDRAEAMVYSFLYDGNDT